MDGPLTKEKILQEAKDRFKHCQEWEAEARNHFEHDKKFAEADALHTEWQWPNSTLRTRVDNGKPVLVINKARQHCLQIVNDQRQNKPSIEVRPTGGGATFKAAQIFEGIVRHIESISLAQDAYDTASWNQVVGGIGWWRVVTDYANDDSFDQEIYIQRIADPLSVYLDPHIQQYDGSDARFGFVFRDMPKDQFQAEYPKYKDIGSEAPLGVDDRSGWITEEDVRVAEYYRKVEVNDKLYQLDTGEMVKASDAKAAGFLDDIKARAIASRDITTHKIEWYMICGNEIIDESTWPGRYIPLVRVVGEETVVNGVMDRKGHVRALIDPQRMFNYMASEAVAYIALQTKTPFIAPVKAIEGYEREWSHANVENLAILPYNSLDEDGKEIAAPARLSPPISAPAYFEGMQTAANQMMAASGQYQSSFGMESNERSGKAIGARQRQGDNATYHYIDHLSKSIRFTGRILVDLIPKVYDTERVIKILAQDGTQQTVQVDPNHPQAHSDIQGADAESFDPQQIAQVLNPRIGYFDVEADIGPNYATQRQEAFESLTQILSQNESLAPIVGDLLFRSADFPLADEIADRLKNMVPPQALGVTNPQVEQLQGMLAQQHQIIQQQAQEVASVKSKAMTDEMLREIDWYKAETDRLKAVGGIDPAAMMPIVRQLVSELLGVPVNQVIAAHSMENAAMLNAAQTITQPQTPQNPQ